MSCVSPGARTAAKDPCVVRTRLLEDSGLRQRLSVLRSLFDSSFGPQGRLHVLHNDSGGQVTCTSSSSRLLQGLSICDPVVRLVTTAVEGHLRLYSDGGHVVTLLSLNLIETCLDLNVNRRLIVEIHELLLESCLEWLNGAPYGSGVDVCNPDDVSKVVRSQLTSKPGCLLSRDDLSGVVSLVRDAFQETFGFAGGAGRELVRLVGIEGEPATHSHLVRGILHETPQIPAYRRTPLGLPVAPSRGANPTVAVALVKVSMAGDSDSWLDVQYEVTGTRDKVTSVLDDAVLAEMLTFAERLVVEGHIGLLACQKVVHPKVKASLRRHGVLVLDRLGVEMFMALVDLAGGAPIATFRTPISDDILGSLRMPVHQVLHGKSYILLQRALGSRGVPVCTLVLCHRSEQALDELKETCRQAIHVLRMYARESRILAGGGCWLTTLASHVHTQTRRSAGSWAQTVGCRENHVQVILDNFCRSLELVTLALGTSDCDHVTDSSSHHHFILSRDSNVNADRMTCQCGAVQHANGNHAIFTYLGREKPEVRSSGSAKGPGCEFPMASCDVIDSFSVIVNGLKTSVNIANMVLSIGNSVLEVGL